MLEGEHRDSRVFESACGRKRSELCDRKWPNLTQSKNNARCWGEWCCRANRVQQILFQLNHRHKTSIFFSKKRAKWLPGRGEQRKASQKELKVGCLWWWWLWAGWGEFLSKITVKLSHSAQWVRDYNVVFGGVISQRLPPFLLPWICFCCHEKEEGP